MNNRAKAVLFYGKGNKEYLGRVLGIINDKEFQAILTNKNIKKQLLRGEGKDLNVLDSIKDHLEGFRLCMVVDTVDDKSLAERMLFISDKITQVSYTQFNNVQKELGLQFPKGSLGQENWMVLSGE